jgi:RNA polymerase-interacting CarD/CdnL/TRCF family regulator
MNTTATEQATPQTIASENTHFPLGTSVIYAMHGKCSLSAIETRTVAGEAIEFYKLEVQKPALSRSTRQEPAIWVPVSSARERGMRTPMDKDLAEQVMKTLTSREYYFPLTETWAVILPKLEASIRNDGAMGMAKVASYLHVLAHKQIVATPEVNRLTETVNKLMYRELSEATGETIRSLEEKVARGMRQKLLASN